MFGVKEVIALLTAAAIGSSATVGINELMEQVNSAEFRASVGVSEVVYECAEKVLASHTDEELIALIEQSGTVGTADETPVQYSLRVCVEQDPFGWAGTEEEWALELLK